MRKGFTLIEALIIVVIVGILVAIFLTSDGKSGDRPGPAPVTNAMTGELLRYEDKTNGVTCYRVKNREGISCLKTSNTF